MRSIARSALCGLLLAALSPPGAADASVMADAFSYTPSRPSRDNTVTGTDSASSVDPYGYSSVSADQVTGTMHLFSHGQFGVASAFITEAFVAGFTGTLTYAFQFVGHMTVSPVPAPYVDGSGYSMQFGIDGYPGCVNVINQDSTPASGPVDRLLTGTCQVTKGVATKLHLSAGVHTSGLQSVADFSDTGILHLILPAGGSLAFADSTFLSDPQPFESVSVTEPSGLALFGSGLALLWLGRRRLYA